MKVHYLEIVTLDVDKVVATYSKLHDVTFCGGDPMLGGARTAPLADGGWVGIRPPMREDEMSVVRPYVLVDDIKAAIEVAEKAGATIAVPPMEIQGQNVRGTCAIFIQGGIESGLWQL